MRDAFFDTAVSAGLGPSKEGRFLLPGADRCPEYALVPLWAEGRDAAFDVIVVHPLQDATEVKAGDRFPFPSGRILGWLAPMCGKGGEEAWERTGQAHWPAGGGSYCPPSGQTGHPASTWEFCHTGQQCSQFPSSSS